MQGLYFLFRIFYLTSVTGLFIYLRDDVIVDYSYTPRAMWISRNIFQEKCYNLYLLVVIFLSSPVLSCCYHEGVQGEAKSWVSVKTYFSVEGSPHFFYRFHSTCLEAREKSRQ